MRDEAQKCPVCDGSGKYPSSGWIDATAVVCHGCNGKGWIKVTTNSSFIIDNKIWSYDKSFFTVV